VTSTLVRRATELFDRPISRRGFIRRMTYGATALSVTPIAFALKPGTAYAAICNCAGQGCDCGSMCCDGYTEFCCTITGQNVCPSGTIPAGWWKADGSGICDDESGPKPRYYLDCNIADCGSCGCGSNGICSGNCQDPHVYACECGNRHCNHRKTGCTGFRYGQCNEDVACVGPIVCRVVTCTAPWVWDSSCSTRVLTDNNTRFHNAPCLQDSQALPTEGIPIVGDWEGDGKVSPGIFVNGRWHLQRSDGGSNIVFSYGRQGDIPVVGDWNGDGIDTPGVVRNGVWHLRNSNSGGSAHMSFTYGRPGDVPMVGDWDGNGRDTPGVFRRSTKTVYLRNSNSAGAAHHFFTIGRPTDIPLVGDFNGNGRDTVSIYRPSLARFYIFNKLGPNGGGLLVPAAEFTFGRPGDQPLIGDWNGDGVDTIGIYRSERFYLRNANAPGPADVTLQ
jgi:hypothetical protein